jgi:hypothetical protein
MAFAERIVQPDSIARRAQRLVGDDYSDVGNI